MHCTSEVETYKSAIQETSPTSNNGFNALNIPKFDNNWINIVLCISMFGFGQRTHIWLGVCSLPPCCVQWGRRGEQRGQCVLLRREGGLRVRGVMSVLTGYWLDQLRETDGGEPILWSDTSPGRGRYRAMDTRNMQIKIQPKINPAIQPKVHSVPHLRCSPEDVLYSLWGN